MQRISLRILREYEFYSICSLELIEFTNSLSVNNKVSCYNGNINNEPKHRSTLSNLTFNTFEVCLQILWYGTLFAILTYNW